MSNIDDILSTASKHTVVRVHNAKVAEESHIYNFIQDNGIKEGTVAVPTRFIYALYCEQFRPPIRSRRFAMYFKNFFKRYATGPKHYYRLDPTPFNIPEGYTIWKELGQNKWKYKKTKFQNIKSTPEGWMIYLDMQGGRQIYGFDTSEVKAAQAADRLLWFYYGPNYAKFNFPKQVKTLTESDPLLLKLLNLKKDSSDGSTE